MNKPDYIVPLPPITKKNHQVIAYNRRTGKRFITQSQQYNDYESKAMWFLKPIPKKPIDYLVEVKCLFYMPTLRLCDLPNHIAAIDDILVKAKILKDDNYKIVASHDGSRVYVDRENPRTEIYITELKE